MDELHQYVQELQSTLQQLQMRKIESVISVLQEARESGRTVFIMGNGGSASTAAHFVCDLAKNTRGTNRPLFRVIGLADNMPIFSAYANDEGYDQVFVQQLASLVRSEDVVIGISASGNSANVLRAIELANEHGATTIGFTGFDGGQLGSLVDIQLHVPSDVIEQVEDIHLVLEHMICSRLRDADEYEIVRFDAAREPGAGDKVWDSLPAKEIHTSVTPPIRWDLAQAARDLDLSKILPRIMILAMESVGAESGTVVLVDRDGKLATSVTAYQGQVLAPTSDKLMDTLENGLAGWVVKNRRAVLINLKLPYFPLKGY